MAYFPGCQAYPAYLREATLSGLTDVALWQTLPAVVVLYEHELFFFLVFA